jgi:23S rRNA pseudouridine2605 synthase
MKPETKDGGERLQKVLARSGIASRRAAEQLIKAGRVRVDGRIVSELGVKVDPRRARVEVDGKKLAPEQFKYVVLHKPRGVMCTLSDPEGRPTIAGLLRGAGARLVPVGRLDFNTSGVLLCTNDGDFASRLAHPKHDVPKEYVAKVSGVLDDDKLERWRESIVIDGRPTRPAEVHRLRVEGDKTWITVRLKEGRNRQVRRLGEHTGFMVMRLSRVSHAGITAEGLRPGEFRELTLDELKTLKHDYGVPKKVHPPEDNSVQRASGPKPREERDAARARRPKPEWERGAKPERGARTERGAKPERGAQPGWRNERSRPQRADARGPRAVEQRSPRPPQRGPGPNRDGRRASPNAGRAKRPA